MPSADEQNISGSLIVYAHEWALETARTAWGGHPGSSPAEELPEAAEGVRQAIQALILGLLGSPDGAADK
jgi:hypothetical protein